MEQCSEATIEKKMGCTWVTLPDAVNMDTYGSIESAIARSAAGCAGWVVFDMGKTNNLFSSGLGLIIRIRKLVMECKGRVVLVNVSRRIRGVLETVRLDKLFNMYATDVEFEISQDELFKRHCAGDSIAFVFVYRLENGVGRILLSGHMTFEQDLSAITYFKPDPSVTRYVFDLTGLDYIDSSGAGILIKQLMLIHGQTGKSVAYGVNENIAGLVEILGLNDYLLFFPDERAALENMGKRKYLETDFSNHNHIPDTSAGDLCD
jgi:anti-anti-sigma factor